MPEVTKSDLGILIGVLSGKLDPSWLDKFSFINELKEDLEEFEKSVLKEVKEGFEKR